MATSLLPAQLLDSLRTRLGMKRDWIKFGQQGTTRAYRRDGYILHLIVKGKNMQAAAVYIEPVDDPTAWTKAAELLGHVIALVDPSLNAKSAELINELIGAISLKPSEPIEFRRELNGIAYQAFRRTETITMGKLHHTAEVALIGLEFIE